MQLEKEYGEYEYYQEWKYQESSNIKNENFMIAKMHMKNRKIWIKIIRMIIRKN